MNINQEMVDALFRYWGQLKAAALVAEDKWRKAEEKADKAFERASSFQDIAEQLLDESDELDRRAESAEEAYNEALSDLEVEQGGSKNG